MINFLVLILIGIYKVLTARGEPDLFVHRMGIREDYSNHLLKLIVGSVGVNYGSYGIALPLKVVKFLRGDPSLSILAVGTLIGVLVSWRIYTVGGWQKEELFGEGAYFRRMGIGIIVFVLGYAIFLTNSQVGFTSTGVMNRTAIAAAVGVAISFVAVIGWISWMLPSPHGRRWAFALMVGVLCVSGFLLSNRIAKFWADASDDQQRVIAAVRQEFPTLPSNTTLVLDGLCPYTGPGIIFECYWDVGGMLRTHYHDTSLRGDIIRSNTRIEEEGLCTFIYSEKKFYPFGDNLLIYNVRQNRTYRIGDSASAHYYFQVLNPDYQSGCPEGSEGYGVAIF
jgi:hypothetical protein